MIERGGRLLELKQIMKKWIKEEGQVLESGYIALQAESHPIDFRRIRLLDLCGCMDPKAKNFKSYFVKKRT